MGCGGGCGGCGGAMSTPIKWGVVRGVSPLMIQFAGDTANVEIDLANTDVTWTVGDNAALVEVAPRRWVAIAKFA